MRFMNHVRVLSLTAACVLVGTTASIATAEGPGDNNTESSLVQTAPPATGPIVVSWTFKKGSGNANLTINPDGTYLFSGQYSGKRTNKDFDIALALKASTGGIMLFHYVGDSTNGVQWSKQGQSSILKDDFSMFASKVSWTAEYHFSETAEGKKLAYEAREKKREEVRKAEEEARKRHDEKVAAEKRAERQKLEREELAQEQQAAQQHQNGGSNVFSTVGDVLNGITGNVGNVVGGAVNTVTNVVGGAVNAVGSAISSVLSIF